MGTIYVARSAELGNWGSDVGLSKHLYKIGYTEEPIKDLLAAGWAGFTGWNLVKKLDGVTGLTDEAVVERLARKVKMVDPNLYPRIKGEVGIFKVLPAHVENHIVLTRALAGTDDSTELKVKPVDFANYLIHNAIPQAS
jgi:hypothetical protein